MLNNNANKFEGKKIFFISDSNMALGGAFEFLRTAFKTENKNIRLYNNAIAGARMDMVQSYIGEELSVCKPDFAFLCFGVNDLGIWLYDSKTEINDEILKEREKRINSYTDALQYNIEYLKRLGIVPVVLSYFCVNGKATLHSDGQVVVDNVEKTQIDESIYTERTFEFINNGLKSISDLSKEIAFKNNVDFWDMYSETSKFTDETCFLQDGIHFNEKGQSVIASLIYKKMFKKAMLFYEIPKIIKELTAFEFNRRSYYFMKYNIIYLALGKTDNKELLNAYKTMKDKYGYNYGITVEREKGFLDYFSNLLENEKKFKDLYDLNL